jgi:hypothetical protein
MPLPIAAHLWLDDDACEIVEESCIWYSLGDLCTDVAAVVVALALLRRKMATKSDSVPRVGRIGYDEANMVVADVLNNEQV